MTEVPFIVEKENHVVSVLQGKCMNNEITYINKTQKCISSSSSFC